MHGYYLGMDSEIPADDEPFNWFAFLGICACLCWALSMAWTAPPDPPPVCPPPPVHSTNR